MCELFGVTSSEDVKINKLLEEFYSHSVKHCHGWGLATLNENNKMEINKGKERAIDSCVLKNKLSLPIYTKVALGHIRYATIGHVEDNNCHPFSLKDITGRTWTLVHNGTIMSADELNKYSKIQKGSTDSERILLYFIELINNETKIKNRELNSKERFKVFDNIIETLSYGNKLNLLFYDEEVLYVHVNFEENLYYKENHKGTFFSTTPLDTDTWYKVPFTRLLGYKDGKKVYEGKTHGNEYKDNPEDNMYIYRYFSEL